jgi:hypothetical protein
MSFSLREVTLAAPLSLSALAGIPAAALASSAPERATELMSIPAFGMIAGIALIVFHWVAGRGIERAARNRLPGEVLHP